MKKFAVTAAAVLFAVLMLAGCSLSVNPGGPSAAPKELSRGTIEDNVYTSEYAGLAFTAPEGWTYATDDQLASLAGISADALTEAGMPVSKEMLEEQGIYDMMVMNYETGSNVIVMYENLSVSLGGVLFSEEKYLEQLKSTLDQTQVYNYEYGDITEQKIGSNTFKLMPAVMTDYDATQYYYVRKIDKYMFCIIFTMVTDDDSSVMDNFS